MFKFVAYKCNKLYSFFFNLNIKIAIAVNEKQKYMRWKYKPEPNPKKVTYLEKALEIDHTLAKLLIQRGIENYDEAKAFFRPSLENLHDPFLMKDMDKAISRILKAIEKKENILVYGDYDVDGTTAVALVAKFLLQHSQSIATYVPDREQEGYGISFQSVDFAYDNDISLVIALDCGIKAIDKIEYANKKHIDYIICDHHTPGEKLPEAVAILNPKQKDCPYPYKDLSGCGIGFKLIQAYQQKQGAEITSLIHYLDLVATSIAADIVPITGENRILAHLGLQTINENPSIGIHALIKSNDKEKLNIVDVVFGIAPRINAAGRLHHAKFAVELLMEEKIEEAIKMAHNISTINEDRKSLDQQITKDALSQIQNEQNPDSYTSVVYQPDWHKGVVGIVASRLIETHYKPTVVFTGDGEILTASARSVKGFDLYKALENCAQYIEQFGGHKYAAGLKIKRKNLEAFKNCFEQTVKKTIKPENRIPEIQIDSRVFLTELSLKFYRILQQMAPFGPGNMQPVFEASGLRDNGMGKVVGSDRKHLKLNIIEGSNNKTYNGIAFNMADKINLLKGVFKIIFTVDINHWNGTSSIQLKIKDIKPDV